MNQLRVKNRNLYEIEVNDKGETIIFNMDDPELMLKFDNAMQKIKRIQENMKAKELILSKQQDTPTKYLLSKNERESIENVVEAFKDMRDAMDDVLGKGGCQKIFGDSNYLTMYNDLFEELEPHFVKMKLNAEKFKEEIMKKYSEDEEDVL